jgi:putative FmdB family regulatory protein
MPTYEYRCRNCGHTFDVVQAMSDEALTVCPVCGGELRKVFAAPAISFKGSGFYATDHGKKSKSTGERSGEKTSEKPAASSESSDGGSAKKDSKGSTATKEPAAAKSSDASSSSSGSGSGSGSSDSKGSGSDGKKKGA